MCLVNDEIQPIRFVLNCVIQSFPNRILSIIGVLCQLSVPADLLCVQKIDMPILQHLHVEGFLCNRDTLAETQFAGLELNLLLGLFVQLRGVRKPNENGLWLLTKSRPIGQCRPKIDTFDQRRSNNRFPCACGGLQGDNLCFLSALVAAERIGNIHPQLFYSFILKGY